MTQKKPTRKKPKILFWKSPTYIVGHGTCRGQVTPEQKKSFLDCSNHKTFTAYTQDRDPAIVQKEQIAAERKKRLGY